jgi:anion-transporting  ArsA/GET3 family ATPase
MYPSPKQFEIFGGTGGVGKTTLATSRAIHLANASESVLLITIDPSKRLKELLNLKEEDSGEVVEISKLEGIELKKPFDALLMNPKNSMDRIAKITSNESFHDNRIIKVLSRPYGGLNEILSVIEVNERYKEGKYTSIILDTPPGSHFLDFLESINKINAFFDQSFVDIFNYLGKKVNTNDSVAKRFMTMIVTSGVKKLLGYLQKVTGANFIDEFIDAIVTIYGSKKIFLEGLKLQERFQDSKFSNWFMITSVEQNKVEEAIELKGHARNFLHEDTYMAINKCQTHYWKDSNDLNEIQKELKENVIYKESQLKDNLAPYYSKILEFKEALGESPLEHVDSLLADWKTLKA